jgi:hypothetical protein
MTQATVSTGCPAVAVPVLAPAPPGAVDWVEGEWRGSPLRALLRGLVVRGHPVSLLAEAYHGPPRQDAGVRVCPGFHDPAAPGAEELRYWWLVRTLRKRVPVDVVLTVGGERPAAVARALPAVGLAERWLHWTAPDAVDPTAGVAALADRLVAAAQPDTDRTARLR